MNIYRQAHLPATLVAEIKESLKELEKSLGKEFGNPKNPLLVSVRSGAKFSMPGMMETVLNVGITPEVAQSLADQTGNPKFAWDSYRRFIDMFGRTVCDIPATEFHRIEARVLTTFNVKSIQELNVEGLQALAEGYIREDRINYWSTISYRSLRASHSLCRSSFPFVEI